MQHRVGLSRTWVLGILLLLLGQAAYAQTYYYRWASAPAFTCQAGSAPGTADVVFASQPVEWNSPASGGTLMFDYITNGTVASDGPYPAPAGSGTQTFGSLLMPGGALPATFSFRLNTLVNGTLVYQSTMSATCATTTSTGTSTITSMAIAPPAAAVPTLGEWSQIVLGLALAGLGMMSLRRLRQR